MISIVEIVGCDSGVVQTQELFRCDAAGSHQACGQIPACYERLHATGMLSDTALFFDQRSGSGAPCISP